VKQCRRGIVHFQVITPRILWSSHWEAHDSEICNSWRQSIRVSESVMPRKFSMDRMVRLLHCASNGRISKRHSSPTSRWTTLERSYMHIDPVNASQTGPIFNDRWTALGLIPQICRRTSLKINGAAQSTDGSLRSKTHRWP
jgi:hypothetical protein